MSKLRVIIGLVVVAASVAIGLVPSLLQLAAERELIRLKERGIRVQIQGITGFFIGVSATSAEGWVEFPLRSGAINAFPLQLSAENVAISLQPRINPFRSSVELSAYMYGGAIGATLLALHGAPRISAKVQGLDIGLHPQLRSIGIERGELQVAVADHPLRSEWQEDATYTLELTNLELVPPSSIQQITGVARLGDGETRLRTTIKKGGAVTIDSGTFHSSLASGTLLGSALIDSAGNLANINATVRVNLDRDDSDKLAAWLPIITNQAVTSDAKSFVCNFRSVGCAGGGSIRLGAGCLRATCAG